MDIEDKMMIGIAVGAFLIFVILIIAVAACSGPTVTVVIVN